MPRNVEIKARVKDADALFELLQPMADGDPVVIDQDDTFFRSTQGRLKLRTFTDGTGELIFYRRLDRTGPKESFYVLSPTTSPDTLREALKHALGVIGRVRKRRTLFMVGRTRVHLDRVESLGDFLELEVVLGDGEPIASGVAEASTLLDRFGIEDSQLIEGAYLDLMQR